MTKFNVAFDDAQRRAYILNEGDENLPDGAEDIGSFEVQDGQVQGNGGDHIFISEAKKLLTDEGFTDMDSITFEDRASNQADPEAAELSIKEVEQRNAARLRGTPETGENPEITLAGKPAEEVVEEEDELTVPDKEVSSESPAAASDGEQKADETQKPAPAKRGPKPKPKD